MKSEALRYFSDISLTVTGMILFLSVYIGVVVWLFWLRRDQDFAQVAALPMEEQQ